MLKTQESKKLKHTKTKKWNKLHKEYKALDKKIQACTCNLKKFCGIFNVEAGHSVQYFCSNENADQSMLKEVQVKGDGNCFFRCRSMYLFGTESFLNAIRTEVVNEMRKHPAMYKELVDPETSFTQHLESMKKCNGNFCTWAAEAEIYAVANILGCEVYVLHPKVTQREMNRYSSNRRARKENKIT